MPPQKQQEDNMSNSDIGKIAVGSVVLALLFGAVSFVMMEYRHAEFMAQCNKNGNRAGICELYWKHGPRR
jgi:hypothetical protein